MLTLRVGNVDDSRDPVAGLAGFDSRGDYWACGAAAAASADNDEDGRGFAIAGVVLGWIRCRSSWAPDSSLTMGRCRPSDVLFGLTVAAAETRIVPTSRSMSRRQSPASSPQGRAPNARARQAPATEARWRRPGGPPRPWWAADAPGLARSPKRRIRPNPVAASCSDLDMLDSVIGDGQCDPHWS